MDGVDRGPEVDARGEMVRVDGGAAGQHDAGEESADGRGEAQAFVDAGS